MKLETLKVYPHKILLEYACFEGRRYCSLGRLSNSVGVVNGC